MFKSILSLSRNKIAQNRLEMPNIGFIVNEKNISPTEKQIQELVDQRIEERISDIIDSRIQKEFERLKNSYENDQHKSISDGENGQASVRSSIMRAIKSAVLECMLTTTGHGLPKIAKPGNIFLSLIWTIFFLIGLAGGIYMICTCVGEYLQFGVITTTKIIRETEMNFPAVTICSSNNLNITNIIVGCRHGQLNGPNCRIDTFEFYDKSCARLDFSKDKSESFKLYGEGELYGYDILFYNYMRSPLQFVITEDYERLIYEEIRENIYPGQMTSIILSKTNQSSLGPPYSQCKETKNYKKANCIEDCKVNKMTKICGCLFPEECGAVSDWPEHCSKDYFKNYFTLHHLSCSMECPIECNLVEYHFSRVDVDIESSPYLDYFLNITGISLDDHKKRSTRMLIYFNKLQTEEITQSPSMSTSSLIAEIGGHLGLFLGLSLLSSVELVDLLIQVFLILRS